jgi:FkbM family methyltransferase
MIESVKKYLRKIIYFPFHILNLFAKIYSKLLSFVDPNGSECYWEEVSQTQIDKRIGSNLRLKNYSEYNLKSAEMQKKIIFHTPNKISSYRAHTYLSKEKDTIEWIEKYGNKNRIFYDIGSNMGVYSIFYAKIYQSKVFSFEPSFRNLDLLVRNIELNELDNYITVIPNPIYKNTTTNTFSQSINRAAGMAMSTFGKKNYNGFNFDTLSFSIDTLMSQNLILPPNLIKIDVDGNELDIIEGAMETIKLATCKTILIETRDSTSLMLEKIFIKCGFKKDVSLHFKSDSNEIWTKIN